MRRWTMGRVLRFTGVYLGLSLVLGLTLLLLAYPDYPMTAAKWLAVFLLILPVQVVFGLIVSRLRNNQFGNVVEGRTRVGYRLFYFLLFIALLLVAAYLWLHSRLGLD